MIHITEHLAKDILALLECDGKPDCICCRLEPVDCDRNCETSAAKLRDALEAAEQNESVSQETAVNNTVLVAEPGKASEYITIPVAEYHFLTKAATLLETILAAERYNPKPTVDAVRTVVEEMIQQHEAGAAE